MSQPARRQILRVMMLCSLAVGRALATPADSDAARAVPFEDRNRNGAYDDGDRDLSAEVRSGVVATEYDVVFPRGARALPSSGSLSVKVEHGNEGSIIVDAALRLPSGSLVLGARTIDIKQGMSASGGIQVEALDRLSVASRVRIDTGSGELLLVAHDGYSEIGSRVSLTSRAAEDHSVFLFGKTSLSIGADARMTGDALVEIASDGSVDIGPRAKIRSPGAIDPGGVIVYSNEGKRVALGERSDVFAARTIGFWLDPVGVIGPLEIVIGSGTKLVTGERGRVSISSSRRGPLVRQALDGLQIWTCDFSADEGNISFRGSTVHFLPERACIARFNAWQAAYGLVVDLFGARFVNFGPDDVLNVNGVGVPR